MAKAKITAREARVTTWTRFQSSDFWIWFHYWVERQACPLEVVGGRLKPRKYSLQFETNIFCNLRQIHFPIWDKYKETRIINPPHIDALISHFSITLLIWQFWGCPLFVQICFFSWPALHKTDLTSWICNPMLIEWGANDLLCANLKFRAQRPPSVLNCVASRWNSRNVCFKIHFKILNKYVLRFETNTFWHWDKYILTFKTNTFCNLRPLCCLLMEHQECLLRNIGCTYSKYFLNIKILSKQRNTF